MTDAMKNIDRILLASFLLIQLATPAQLRAENTPQAQPFPTKPAADTESTQSAPPLMVVYPFKCTDADPTHHSAYFQRLIAGRASRAKLVSVPLDIDLDDAFENDPFDPNAGEDIVRAAGIHAARAFPGARYICTGEIVHGKGGAVTVRAVIVDLKDKDAPVTIADKTWTLETIEQAPPSVSTFLTEAFGRHDHLGVTPDAACVATGNNLVANPGFSMPTASPHSPTQPQSPLKSHTVVQTNAGTQSSYPAHWTDASQEQDQWGRLTRPVLKQTVDPSATADDWCLEFQPNKRMATVYGLIVYSDPIPITQGKYYRIKADVKSTGPRIIVFIKGFGRHEGLNGIEKRMTYKFQVRPEPDPPTVDGWVHIVSRPFQPKHPRDTIDYVKVMLYVYTQPNKKAWFDNIVLEEVQPTSRTQTADFEHDNRRTPGWKKHAPTPGDGKETK